MEVVAIVVTYNRKELLEVCLKSFKVLSFFLQLIFVIDIFC